MCVRNQECYSTKQQTIDLYRALCISNLVAASCSRRLALRPPPPSSTASALTPDQTFSPAPLYPFLCRTHTATPTRKSQPPGASQHHIQEELTWPLRVNLCQFKILGVPQHRPTLSLGRTCSASARAIWSDRGGGGPPANPCARCGVCGGFIPPALLAPESGTEAEEEKGSNYGSAIFSVRTLIKYT